MLPIVCVKAQWFMGARRKPYLDEDFNGFSRYSQLENASIAESLCVRLDPAHP